MKLRIKGDSIRMRLTQTEVSTFGETGVIEDRVRFAPEQALIYRLQREEQGALRARLQGNALTVFVPDVIAGQWVGTQQVGFRGEVPLESSESSKSSESGVARYDGDVLRILVEKDFHCLVPRPDEDESDHYANPLAQSAP